MSQQTQQVVPGQLFRVPLLGAPPRSVYEEGPAAPLTSITLNQSAQSQPNFNHFSNLDIIRGYLLELDFTTTFTQATGETLTPSPMFPANLVSNITVSMQAAYNTFNLPGWLAWVMQSYRSFLGPKAATLDTQEGANVIPYKEAGANFYANTVSPATPGLAANVAGTQQTYSVYFEIPIAQYFDLYYELNPQDGGVLGAAPRAIVSPARMAATQRNVTPIVLFNALLGLSQYNSPIAKASGDTTSTGTGSVLATWFRDGWVPTDNPETEPPGYGWQYSRQSISIQPAQATSPTVNLADDRAGQGQILSVVFGTWDPTLNSNQGGFTPPSDYSLLKLRKGSTVDLFQDTPNMNTLRWAERHGKALPFGLFGWDLALTEDGRITNENALNTLVEAGCQIVPTYSAVPSSGSTLYVGVESLQAVTN